MRATGEAGELRVGGKAIATLGEWAIEPQGRSFVLEAEVATADPFWINERPIDVVLSVANVGWLWRDASVSYADGAIVVPLKERPIVEDKATI